MSRYLLWYKNFIIKHNGNSVERNERCKAQCMLVSILGFAICDYEVRKKKIHEAIPFRSLVLKKKTREGRMGIDRCSRKVQDLAPVSRGEGGVDRPLM